MTGVLSGVRIVELAGMGPAPFRGMILADKLLQSLGYDVADLRRRGVVG